MALVIRKSDGTRDRYYGSVAVRFEDGSLLVSEKYSIAPVRPYGPGEWIEIEHEEE